MSKYYMSVLLLLTCMSALITSGSFLTRWSSSGLEVSDSNAEARLALGGSLSLWTLGVYELELLPRISDKLAKKILLQRAEVHAKASTLPKEEKYIALETVKGLGPKSAKRLSPYLDLSSPAADPASSR